MKKKIMMRVKHVLTGEDGYLVLEAAIVVLTVCLICTGLFLFIGELITLQSERSGYTASTGWFRTHNTNGIMDTTP